MSFPTPKDYDAAPNPTAEPTFPDDLSRSALRDAIAEYQQWCADHYDELSIDLDGIPVEVSMQMKRTAGKVAHLRQTGEVKFIRYAYKAYDRWGWEQFAETIRHELIHVHTVQNFGEGNHGPRFKALVGPLETTRHCETFAEAEAKYLLRCSGCDEVIDYRFQRSKVVKHPEQYRSKCCNAPLAVEHN